MQSYEQQCSWRIFIFVRAKANRFNFNLRFRGASLGPHWTLHRFSFILNFRNFLIFRLNSHRPPPVARRSASRLGLFRIRTRVVNVIQKFQARIIAKKNRSTSANRGWISEHPKDSILIGLWVLLAFVVEAIWKKYGKGMFLMVASVGFMAGLLMKKDKRAKLVKARGVIVMFLVACSLLFMLVSYWNTMGVYAAKQVWEFISSS